MSHMKSRRKSFAEEPDESIPSWRLHPTPPPARYGSWKPGHSRATSNDILQSIEEDGKYEDPAKPSLRPRPARTLTGGTAAAGTSQNFTTGPYRAKSRDLTASRKAPYPKPAERISVGEGPEAPASSDIRPVPSLHQSLENYRLPNDGPSSSTTNEREAGPRDRTSKRRTIIQSVIPATQLVRDVGNKLRKSSIYETYENAKKRTEEVKRKRWAQLLFEYSFYTLLLAFVFFVLVGKPLWNGLVYWTYILFKVKFIIPGGWSITLGIAALYAFTPLLILFEDDPPVVDRPADFDVRKIPGVSTTALIIPCYKAAKLIGATIEASLKVFPPENIFVIANGNSETPLDDTEDVCRPYNVNHIWSPVGSKIVAQFVGCYAAKDFDNVLLIDDDCAIPPNFPVVSDQLVGRVKCIGYTIKSVGPGSSKGNWCVQAQDLEYKLSGLQRAFAGKIGSATFPHGAISLWDRKFLVSTFYDHPGFSISEDWFMGHSCRRLGGRITMCTSIFVETETPDAIFFSSGGERGGFGEMTVFKQRFWRWNFFFVSGIGYNLGYIFGSWKLRWWDVTAKLFVFQEIYETLLYILTPLILPISLILAPLFTLYVLLGTTAMYLVNSIIFNEVHLRLKKERVSLTMLLVYYLPYKLVLTLVNVASCYWSLFKYAQYFAKPQLKITEDENAVRVVMELEDDEDEPSAKDGPNAVANNRTSVVIDAAGKRLSFMEAPRRMPLNRIAESTPSVPEGSENTPSANANGSKSMRISFITGYGMSPTAMELEQLAGRKRSEAVHGQIVEEEEVDSDYERHVNGPVDKGRKGSWAHSFV